MKIYTPNLAFVKYNGDIPRKLWEARSRKVPTLENGDLVLLPEVTAVLMVKKYGFEMVQNKELCFAGEKNQNNNEDFLNIKFPNDINKEEKEKFAKAVTEFLEEYSDALKTPQYNITDAELLNALLTGIEDGDFKREDVSEYEENLLQEHEKALEDDLKNDLQDNEKISQKEDYVLPTKADLEKLNEEQIKYACEFVGINIGKKQLKTLKKELHDYLPE